jgi:hypothetical protein
VALGAVALGIVWIVVTGLLARAQLEHVRGELPKLRAALLDGRTADARALAQRITVQTQRAHAVTTGPAWWVAANLPGIGSPLRTTRAIAAAADDIGRNVAPPVVELSEQVAHLRPVHSAIDIARIQDLVPDLHGAALAAGRANRQVAGTGGSWFGPVSSARASLLRQLTSVDDQLSGADRAVRIAVPLFGAQRPQRIFVGFLNEAEARGVGGIPGAFAIVSTDHGSVRFDHFGSDAEFNDVRARVDLGARFEALYGQDDPTGTFPNSDISPDFRNAGRIWAGLWQAKTGQHVDAAIAVDATALSYVLAVTGPARAPDGHAITAANIVPLTQRDLYARFGSGTAADDARRKQYVVDLAKAVSARLTASGGDPHRLVRALSRAAGERRFVVWSADAAVENDLLTANWAGAVTARVGTPYTGLVVNDAAGGKLDYYLERSLRYTRSRCGAGPATATIRLTNTAPAGLPPYVTVRADKAPAAARPGDTRLLAVYYASAGAEIESVTVDGRPAAFVANVENGVRTASVDLELPRGATRVLQVRVREPAAVAPVTVLRQPLVRPLAVDIRAPACG